MKSTIFVITTISLLLGLTLSACSSPSQETGGEGIETESASTLDDNYENAMPISTQLMLGTLKLEGTGLAVDPSQAAELLVLWKAARSLSESDNVATAEMEAIFKQIQDAMTADQIEAIAAMQLTREDMTQLAQDMGIEFGFGAGSFGDMSPEMQATAQAARESGLGGPGGGVPGAGGGFGRGDGLPGGEAGGVEQLSPEQRATLQAERTKRGNIGARLTLVLADPLIELLETRAQE